MFCPMTRLDAMSLPVDLVLRAMNFTRSYFTTIPDYMVIHLLSTGNYISLSQCLKLYGATVALSLFKHLA